MKIFFVPDFSSSGFVYMNPIGEDKIYFDVSVANIQGLIELLAKHAGRHFNFPDRKESLSLYCEALRDFTHTHTDSMLTKSLTDTQGNINIDVKTAKVIMNWRETLRIAGWDESICGASKRLDELAEIEGKYINYIKDKIELEKAILELCSEDDHWDISPDSPGSLQIYIPCELGLMHPLLVKLLESLKDRNVKISKYEEFGSQMNNNTETYDIDVIRDLLFSGSNEHEELKGDSSFQIWNFQNENDSLRHLSTMDDNDYDVWINSNPKRFDDWLYFRGKPTTGGKLRDNLTIPSKIFIAWKKCMGNHNSEQSEESKEVLISMLSNQIGKSISLIEIERILKSKNKFQDFITDLKDDYYEQKDTQWFEDLNNFADTYHVNLWNDRLDYKDSKELFGELFNCYGAKQGCRSVIHYPWLMVNSARSCIWCDFYNADKTKLSTDFLSSEEYVYLNEEISYLWDKNKETRFHEMQNLLPFRLTTKKMVLVTVKNINQNPVRPHPLFLKIKNLLSDNQIKKILVEK